MCCPPGRSLLALLAERQRLIDHLSQTSAGLEPFRHSWEAVCEELSEAERRRVRTLVVGAQSLLDGILRRDEQDRQRLASARSGAAGRRTPLWPLGYGLFLQIVLLAGWLRWLLGGRVRGWSPEREAAR